MDADLAVQEFTSHVRNRGPQASTATFIPSSAQKRVASQYEQGVQMECLRRTLPSLLPPTSVQLTGYALLKEEEKGGSVEQWLNKLPNVLEKRDTTSLIIDSEFVRRLDTNHWDMLLKQLGNVSSSCSIMEYHVDLRLMEEERDLYPTVQWVRSLLLKRPEKGSGLEKSGAVSTEDTDNHVKKLAIFGMKSRYAPILSAMPDSLNELLLFYSEESDREFDDEPGRRTRIEAMVQQYVTTHPNLTAISMKYDDNADDLLPISAYALAALIGCPGMVKIEFERCSVSSHEEEENHNITDANNEERDLPEQALYQALRDNTMLFLLRFRAGSLQTSLAENIARALEIGNRSLRYLDLGDQEGVGDTVGAGVAKAIMRNPILAGLEMNLNSIRDFQFTSLGNLTCLDLSDNFIRDEGALQLAQLIPACRLERINLADNGIGQIGGCAIAWSLMHNNSITKMNICNNPLLSPDLDVGGGPTSDVTARVYDSFKDAPAYQQGFLGMMCSSLRHNKTLTFVNFANTGLDDSHGPLLAILFRVSNLVGVGLLRNRIGDQACIYMCQALSKYRTNLRALMIELNPISARGFYAMWKGVLSVNDTLMNVSWGNTTYMIKGVERGQRDLDISLKINRAGMLRLRRDKDSTKEEWVEALINLRDDLDCSFTFLSENSPLLF